MPRAYALLVVLSVAGCAPQSDASPAATPRAPRPPLRFEAPAGFDRLRFGVVPALSRPTSEQLHAPLASHLQQQLGVPVQLEVAASYSDAVERVVRGEWDLVKLTPYSYVLATERVALTCLAQEIVDGSATTSSYVFVRDDSPRKSLADLDGVSFAFVDPSSVTGYLLARKLLVDARVAPAREQFLGDHEAVLMAVRDGTVEAGATFQGAFTSLRKLRGIDPHDFRVLGKSARTPRDVLCARAGLPAAVVGALREILLGLTARERPGRDALLPLNINGFQAPDDAAYDEVRRVAKQLAGPR